MSFYNRVYASIGDFEEEYYKIRHERSRLAAHGWYWSQVFRSLPAYYTLFIYWRLFMFKNYLKIALRNINKHKGYSFLNVLGLAIGIACFIFIFLYAQFELSYDKYHLDSDRIYRVAKSRKTEAKLDLLASNVTEVAPALKERFPEVEAAARIGGAHYRYIKVGDRIFMKENVVMADPEIFDILSMPFILGDKETALSRPGTMVLTRHIADKYFGQEIPVGKTILLDTTAYEITAVVEDCPPNTHMKYEMIGFLKYGEGSPFYSPWGGWHCMNYIKLGKGVDPDAFEEKIRFLPHEYIGDRLKEQGVEFTLFLQSIEDIHLHSHLSWEAEPSGNPLYVNIFSGVGVFILLIAAMNFINLTTARSATRSTEVGMRKVVGALRRQLIMQFLGESILISFLSFIIAFLIVCLSLPHYNNLAGMEYAYSSLFKPGLFFTLFGLVVLIGIAGGCYPAFFLSAFRPTAVLRGMLKSGTRGTVLRKALVVGQFAISIVLIIGTIIFYQQLHFMKNQHLGFDKEKKLVIEFDRSVVKQDTYEAVKAEFLKHPSIKRATFSSSVPGRWMYFWNMWPAGGQGTNNQMVNSFQVDYDFFPEYDVELVAGRIFQKALGDKPGGGWIINEAAMKAFGWQSPEESLTKHIYEETDPILGVARDFHYRGLQTSIDPVAIFLMTEDFRYLTLTVDVENLDEIFVFIDEKYRELFPDALYEYFFLDTDFNLQYQIEERLGQVFRTFTFLGILIACLGLIGLASFVAEQRTKEIGIRKVLGASVPSIVAMLSKAFVKWVLIANIIAWPVAWVGMKYWLQDFAYRIDIGILPFVLSSGIALLIAVITVSYQSIKAGRSDPVKALKFE